MKKRYKYLIIKFIFLISIIFGCSIITNAHPGNTDINGGHNVTSTGKYHYHHGYPAHQHENGICPYNFDDKIIHNNINKNVNKENELIEYKESNKVDYFHIFICSFFILLVIAYFICPIIAYFTYEMKNKKKKDRKEHNNYLYYFSCYSFCEPIKFVEIPKYSYIRNGLPITKGNGKYGKYTVYISAKGKCFHKNMNCSRNLKEINYVHSLNKTPCKNV